MRIPWPTVRLFQLSIHLWLVGYLISALPAAEWLWDPPVSPPLPGPPGPFRYLTHAFGTWLPGSLALPAVGVLLALGIRGIFRPSRWWSAFMIWVLFTSLMDHAWLAATGGHQLIANVLFWMIFLPSAPMPEAGSTEVAAQTRAVITGAAFWIIRLQLLIAYGTTAIHKLTGLQWMHGHAVGIVATDPDYGPAFLAGAEPLLTVLTFAILAFQLTFPLAVWWRPTRRAWMWMGVCFHLATGLSFGILDMGLAFLATYPIWCDPECAARWRRKFAFAGR